MKTDEEIRQEIQNAYNEVSDIEYSDDLTNNEKKALNENLQGYIEGLNFAIS